MNYINRIIKRQSTNDQTWLIVALPIARAGWWLVESEGEVGWAPALYLEPADEMTEYGNIQTFQVGRGEII